MSPKSVKESVPKKKTSTSPRFLKVLPFVAIVLGLAVLAGVGYLYFSNRDLSDIWDSFKSSTDSESVIQPKRVVCVSYDIGQTVLDTVDTWSSSLDDGSSVELVRFSGTSPKEADACEITISRSDQGNSDLVWQKYFVVVANRDSKLDTITSEEIARLLGMGSMTIENDTYSVAISNDSFDSIDRMLGVGVGVETEVDAEAAVEKDQALVAIVPFEVVSSNVKIISVDGISLIETADISAYPLVEEVWVEDNGERELFNDLQSALGVRNFNPENVRTVVMTGTSVIGARGHYQRSIEMNDWLYGLRKVGDVLQEADVAHISNEASFADDCEQNSWTMMFCGPTESFEAMTWAGIDVVGLTGNHILDAGRDNFIKTLDLYETSGMQYFGGGKTYTDAHTPAVVDLGGIKIAFFGYNMIPPAEYNAEGENPGSAGFEADVMKGDIAAVRDEVDFVFVDMQWGLEYVRYPDSYQMEYGHAAIDAGADVVNGVHPHWVQPVENYHGGLIFYSLGNFVFDQLWSLETREGVMVTHYFYGDTYLGYKAIPTLLSEDMQVDIAQGADRDRILGYLELDVASGVE